MKRRSGRILSNERFKSFNSYTSRYSLVTRYPENMMVMNAMQVVTGPSSVDNVRATLHCQKDIESLWKQEVQQLKAEIKEKEEIIQGMKKDLRHSQFNQVLVDVIARTDQFLLQQIVMAFKDSSNNPFTSINQIHRHRVQVTWIRSFRFSWRPVWNSQDFGQDGTCWCKNITPEYVQHLEVKHKTKIIWSRLVGSFQQALWRKQSKLWSLRLSICRTTTTDAKGNATLCWLREAWFSRKARNGRPR